MPTIRIREPIQHDPPEWTIEWYGVYGDGCWMLLRDGMIVSLHDYKWLARLARRRAIKEAREG
jgi:hypothetical protein